MERPLVLATLILPLTLPACSRGDAHATTDTAAPVPTMGPLASLVSNDGWNDAQIAWRPYEAGLAEAKAQNKPVCLILHTAWCPHCKNYKHVFADPKIVERARRFVMIQLDADQHRDIAQKYTPDGGYVPRTFFLAPDGTLAADIHAPRPKYQYFYDEHNPASLLGGMDRALAKLSR